MANPVFCFGFQRSGTTLLSMMLDSHPDFAVPFSVTGLWYKYDKKIHVYDDLRSLPDLERLVDDLLKEERIRLWQVPLGRETVLSDLPLGNYPAVIARFHTLYARHHGKCHWGHLDIATLVHMGVAMKWFSDAKFVHLVRDGRDVALSNQDIPYSVGNLGECATAWHQDVSANLKLGERLGSERYLAVPYERLVAQPEVALRSLCDFLCLPFSPAMLDYTKKVRQRVPADRLFLWPKLADPPDSTRAFRWKVEMSAAQRTVFETIAGPTLHALGYETELTPRVRGRAKLLEAWYALGRGHRWPRLAQRLGFARGRGSR